MPARPQLRAARLIPCTARTVLCNRSTTLSAPAPAAQTDVCSPTVSWPGIDAISAGQGMRDGMGEAVALEDSETSNATNVTTAIRSRSGIHVQHQIQTQNTQ